MKKILLCIIMQYQSVLLCFPPIYILNSYHQCVQITHDLSLDAIVIDYGIEKNDAIQFIGKKYYKRTCLEKIEMNGDEIYITKTDKNLDFPAIQVTDNEQSMHLMTNNHKIFIQHNGQLVAHDESANFDLITFTNGKIYYEKDT